MIKPVLKMIYLYQIMTMNYALERTVHFLSEERTEAYLVYGEGVLAAEKCTGCQELLQGSRLCRLAGGRGA